MIFNQTQVVDKKVRKALRKNRETRSK